MHNGYIFVQVTKGMHGLPKSGKITHDALVKHLEPYVYRPPSNNPVLCTHESRPINFTLLVDDFGVKYLVKEHALQFKSELG